MSVGAAIRITSAGEERAIQEAADFARRQGVTCFVISIVPAADDFTVTDDQRTTTLRNLELIATARALPVLQEGSNVPRGLLAAARGLGIDTLFIQSGRSGSRSPSVAERLLNLDPPFDVVIMRSS